MSDEEKLMLGVAGKILSSAKGGGQESNTASKLKGGDGQAVLPPAQEILRQHYSDQAALAKAGLIILSLAAEILELKVKLAQLEGAEAAERR